MKFRWNHAVIAVALAGATAFAPVANAAPLQQTTEPNEAPPGTRRDIRQDTRQLRSDRRDIRQDRRQLRTARRTYGVGSPRARAVHRDLRQDRRSANHVRRDRNRDIRIHQRRVARR
jgi:hypothetical protein